MSDETRSEPTFGARFLDEWKSLGGPISRFSYEEIQELRACDREGMVQALRRHNSLIEYRTLQRIRAVEDPEQLAREMFASYQIAATTSAWMMFALIT